MSPGLADMLATEGACDPSDRGEYAKQDYRGLAEASLKAAHESMQKGNFREAHDHMAAWSEHHKKIDYDKPSPPQNDAEGDDDARGMMVVPHRG